MLSTCGDTTHCAGEVQVQPTRLWGTKSIVPHPLDSHLVGSLWVRQTPCSAGSLRRCHIQILLPAACDNDQQLQETKYNITFRSRLEN